MLHQVMFFFVFCLFELMIYSPIQNCLILFVFRLYLLTKIFLLNLDFPFSIDVHTGELFAQGFIDREQKEIYTFEVTVRISFRSIN